MGIYFSIAIGGAVGCVARFFVTNVVQQRLGAGFPAGTLIINVAGSFLLAVIMRYLLQSGSVSVETRSLLTTGFCGGFTTFSTFSYDTVMLINAGEYRRATLYVAGSVALSLIGVVLGLGAANRILSLRPVA